MSSPSTPSSQFPPNVQEIIDLLQSVQEPKAKYQQLLFYSQILPTFDKKYQTNDNKVQGCVSQVWVRATLDDDRNVWFEAESDPVLTKGLSGRLASEILRTKALILDAEAVNGVDVNKGESSGSEAVVRHSNKGLDRVNGVGLEPGLEAHDDAGGDAGGGSDNGSLGGGGDSGSNRSLGSQGERIREKLERELKPVELVIEDVSYQHAGHAGMRGRTDGETHLNVYVVSEAFEGKTFVKRHRMIYSLLQDELHNGLHALSIVAKTPSEFSSSTMTLVVFRVMLC
ncbi:SufE-like protein [Drosera capensis]